MLFLSEVKLPPGIPPYCLHQYLYSFFPSLAQDASRPFVFRQIGEEIVMLSSIPPAVDYVEISSRIQLGHSYGFDAILNPTEIVDGKVKALYGNDRRQTWLRQHALGCEIGFMQVFDLPSRRFQGKTSNTIYFVPARFQGVLCVTDREQFEDWLLRSPGKAKVYGCGLIFLPDIMSRIEVQV